MTARRARVLAVHLPPDAAVWRVGPDDMLWSREVQQIAALRNDLRGLLLGNKAEPVARPSDPPRRASASVEDKAAMFMARQRAKRDSTW